MSVRTETIANIFAFWLRGYSPPKIMLHDGEVMKAERDKLLRVLLHFAPQSNYEGWVNRALDQLEYQMKTRAWPTKGELGSVCSNLRKETHTAIPSQSEWKLDPVQIAAGRINAGEAVGDNWLYGRDAVVLLQSGKVTRDRMRQYRSTLYFSAKNLHKKDEADRREAEWIKRHEDAERLAGAADQGVNPAAVSAISGAVSNHLRRVDGGCM